MNSAAAPIPLAQGPCDAPGQVLLSGKEIAGLALRVVGTALMPFGARGGAADAVEFLELCDGSGLARLEGEMEHCRPAMWQAPQVAGEAGGLALVQAQDASALFYAAPCADWLAALAGEHGQACIGVLGGQHAHYLHAIPYWLACRGHTGLVLQWDRNAGAELSVASAHAGGWWYARRAGAPGPADALARQVVDLDALGAWRACLAQWAGSSMAEAESPAPADAGGLGPSVRPLCVIYAATAPVSAPRRASLWTAGAAFTSADFQARKRRAGADGWPIGRQRWEHLMRFADLSLIPSSEQSRAGAG